MLLQGNRLDLHLFAQSFFELQFIGHIIDPIVGLFIFLLKEKILLFDLLEIFFQFGFFGLKLFQRCFG